MKLTSNQIKQQLSEIYLCKPNSIKRISKNKNADNNTIERIFTVGTIHVCVTTDALDERVVKMKKIQFQQTKALNQTTLMPLIPLTTREFENKATEYAYSYLVYEKKDLLQIFGIYSVQLQETHPTNDFIDADRIMSFLLIYTDKALVHNVSYGFEENDLDVASATILTRPITGLYVNTDVELTDPSFHTEIQIPENTKVLLSSPQADFAIFLSEDLRSGITTTHQLDSGLVTSDKTVLNSAVSHVESIAFLEEDHELTEELRRLLNNYDFIVSHH